MSYRLLNECVFKLRPLSMGVTRCCFIHLPQFYYGEVNYFTIAYCYLCISLLSQCLLRIGIT